MSTASVKGLTATLESLVSGHGVRVDDLGLETLVRSLALKQHVGLAPVMDVSIVNDGRLLICIDERLFPASDSRRIVETAFVKNGDVGLYHSRVVGNRTL